MALNINKIIHESLDSQDGVDLINTQDNSNEEFTEPATSDDYQEHDDALIEQASSIAISCGMGALNFVKKLRSLQETKQESDDSNSTEDSEESNLDSASKIAKNALKKGSALGQAITKKIIKS